jgi:hypothetical protein
MAVPAQAQFRNNDFRMAGKDSAITYASDQYKSNSFLHHLLMGKNYRKSMGTAGYAAGFPACRQQTLR